MKVFHDEFFAQASVVMAALVPGGDDVQKPLILAGDLLQPLSSWHHMHNLPFISSRGLMPTPGVDSGT